MSIRYKYFLRVCLLFAAVFMTSFFIENIVQKKALLDLRQYIIDFYAMQQKDKQEYLEKIVRSAIGNKLVEVDTILKEISSYEVFEDVFAPTEDNIKKGTWKNAVRLLQSREDIDLIQNTYDSSVLSLIHPFRTNPREVSHISSGCADFIWSQFSNGEKDDNSFYIGIPIELKNINQNQSINFEDHLHGLSTYTCILYDVTSIINFPVGQIRKKFITDNYLDSKITAFFDNVYLDLLGFLDRIERVQALLKEQPEKYAPPKGSKSLKPPLDQGPCNQNLECLMKNRISYTSQIFSIWKLCSLMEAGFTENSWSSSYAPIGSAQFLNGNLSGNGFYVSDVLSQKRMFDAASYFEARSELPGQEQLAAGIAVFIDPARKTVYLGNVAKFTLKQNQKIKEGYLTLGFELENVINQMSLSYEQTALVVVGNKIVSSILPSKQISGDLGISQDDVNKIISTKAGKIQIGDIEQYFINITPFKEVDLSICLLTPVDIEYKMLKDFQNRSEELVIKTTINRDIVIFIGIVIMIISVFTVVGKNTKPIIAIAFAARAVQKGKLNEAVLPELNLGKNNEVQILHDAFKDMIEGLKEKERVKGILDKVVSEDIAHEILEQGIKLGGEERKVTIFFADIRGFTKMTQKMDPSDVIKMLNVCMTKLSKVIERYHGVIDKYVGDEVMVLFGAPVERENATIEAIKCGLEVMLVLKEWNEVRKKENLPEILMGIGIHTGLVFAGNMGAENRLNYTVIGNNVNLAARLCAAAGPGEIFISADAIKEKDVVNQVVVDDMGPLNLKGYEGAQQVFKVKGLKCT